MTGIIRGMDPQRRVIIPKETLLAAGLEARDLIELYSDVTPDGVPSIVLQKYQPGCVICSSRDDMRHVKGKRICYSCVEEVKDIREEGGE